MSCFGINNTPIHSNTHTTSLWQKFLTHIQLSVEKLGVQIFQVQKTYAAARQQHHAPPSKKSTSSFDELIQKINRFINETGAQLFSFISPLKVHKGLRLTELNQEQKQIAKKVALAWEKIAEEKLQQLPPILNGIFLDSIDICQWVRAKLTDKKELRFIACTRKSFDPKKPENIEAIAVFSRQKLFKCVDGTYIPYLYLEALATNPKNHRSSVNEHEPNRVTGAGTQMINHLKMIAQGENLKQIRLSSLPAARGFYTKLGFNQDSTHEGIYFLNVNPAI